MHRVRVVLLGGLVAVACLTMVAAADPAEEGRHPKREAAEKAVEARVINQAQWSSYVCPVRTRLLIEGKPGLGMLHEATFGPEGRATLKLLSDGGPVVGGIFTKPVRGRKRRKAEEWRNRLVAALDFYWAITPGQALDWFKKATITEKHHEGETRLITEGTGYALPKDHLTAISRPGKQLPDAMQVLVTIKGKRVEMDLETRYVGGGGGDQGPKMPYRVVAEVPEEYVRMVMDYGPCTKVGE